MTHNLRGHPVARTSSSYPRKSGFAAGSQLTRCGRLTALRFRSKRSRTYDYHQTVPRGLKAGFDRYHAKPLDFQALMQDIASLLRPPRAA